MAKISIEQMLLKAKSHAKKGERETAQTLYQTVLNQFPKNQRAQKGLAALGGPQVSVTAKAPKQSEIAAVIDLYNQGYFSTALKHAKDLINRYPNAVSVWNILGAIHKELTQLPQAYDAFSKVTQLNPSYADGHNNLGVVLHDLGKLEAAQEAYHRAISLKPMYAEAYYNMANALRDQGQFDQAVDAYEKATSLRANYAEAHNNLGNALQDLGKLDQAIHAYREALTHKPDYAQAHFNMGNALRDQDKLDQAAEAYKEATEVQPNYAEAHNNLANLLQRQGKLDDAIARYKQALTFKPDYAEALRHLSLMVTHDHKDAQINTVETLLERSDLWEADRCHLHYAYAKMKADLGEFKGAYENYVAGGALRKTQLRYQFHQDQELFRAVKRTAPLLQEQTLPPQVEPASPIPIFILGMPRSGTTLVEQIISSHSFVNGAGELTFASRFGARIAQGIDPLNVESLSEFRTQYLSKARELAQGSQFQTDKMPQNFRWIALICAALPEAKIIHVTRNAQATCWSNFTHYFSSQGLGYSYTLADTVQYYHLYSDLMSFWDEMYQDRIYHLNYERLTDEPEGGIRALIKHLGMDWEDACLTPHNNTRAVNTASHQQVRQKIYKGSSKEWRTYEMLINGAFESLQKSSA